MAYLKHVVNGKVVSKTLCTSHYHANNIWRDLLSRMDPFVWNGCLVASVQGDEDGTTVSLKR
jgi:hypothetical protein